MNWKKKPWGRRILALALCAVLFVTALSGYALASDGIYLDTTVHWCREPIRFWTEHKVVEGVGGDLFRPDSPITRQTAAVVICRFLGLEQTPVTEDPFPDVPASSPYAAAIAACKRVGLVEGYPDGRYRPEEGIVRNAAMVLLARVYRFTPCEDLSALSVFEDGGKAAVWARGYIAAMVEADIVHGWSGKLRDADICTRAEFVEMLRCFISAYYDVPGLYNLSWITDDRFIAFVTGDITLTGETDAPLLILPGASGGRFDFGGSKVGGGADVWGKDTKIINARPGTVIRTGPDAGTTLVNGVEVPPDTTYIVPWPGGGSGGGSGGNTDPPQPPAPSEELSLSWWDKKEGLPFGTGEDGSIQRFLPGDSYSRTYRLEVKSTKNARVVFTQTPANGTDTELAKKLECRVTVYCGTSTATYSGSLADWNNFDVQITGSPDAQELVYTVTVTLPTDTKKDFAGRTFATNFQWELEAVR